MSGPAIRQPERSAAIRPDSFRLGAFVRGGLEGPARIVADVVEGLVDRPSPAIPDGLEIGIVILEADGEVLLQRIAPVDQKVDRRTDRAFERMVESNEISAHLAASLKLVLRWMMRSRMGLPYFTSPIWK